jgi:tRNA 2-thiouridine synthesizing protein A
MTDIPAKSIDLKGMRCPMPVIKISRAIREVNIGESLEAFITDPAINADIPAWCRSTGHELVALEKQDTSYHIVVRRTK